MTLLAVAAVVPSQRPADELADGVIVTAGDLSAVAYPVESVPVPMTRKNLLQHSEVVEAVAARATAVPVAFGTVFDSGEEVVAELLNRHRGRLRSLLQYLDGKVEIRVFGNYREEVLVREAAARPAVRRLRNSGAGLSAQIALGEAVADEVAAIQDDDELALLRWLSPHAAESTELPRSSSGIGGGFLVDEERLPSFDDAVEALAGANSDRLAWRVVGPLPPWDFASLDSGAA